MAARCWSSFLHCFFDYETPKTIVIYNKGVGSIFRFIQFLIIAYVIGYVCLVQKGYQETEAVISSATTKVKGYAATNTSALGLHVWDVTEYVIPPQGDDSFFVLTNIIPTPGQIQQACPEVPHPSSICESDDDCSEGRSPLQGNGVQTGRCVNYSASVKTCQVLAWCPHEDDSNLPKPALLLKAENFTVMIKNSVRYPKFGFSKKNILANVSKGYLKTCRYHSTTDPHCPIFRLGDMVHEAGADFPTMAEKGGVMAILIDWSCDLDWPEKDCVPKYSFVRMDKSTHNTAPGFNFRFAKYSNNGSIQSRTLIKGFGIRFDVIVFGTAGKFSVLLTVVNLGAALSFLSLVGAVCDWVLVTCTAKKDFYTKHKTSYLTEEGTGEVISFGKSYGTS
ncbi:P2X purinoceptor 4b isoform X2 [Alosa sapidissima]|uniref:P2X purinoceptor 4b isoform X2 n=1 Tax=Alosa sapidissima TaxID=34773 RepID=UPI001C097C59|nr:P2X purinoceptor 4b isoform X2 [Alosa sapidissima]